MSKIKTGKNNPFMALAVIQVVFACIILTNELLAINNRVPGGNYPIEIKSSWTRVLLFVGGAIISVLVAWVLNSKNQLLLHSPSLKSVLMLAVFPTSLSVLSNYFAFMGWCCEQPLGYFFGFPFSFLLGVGGFDYSAMQPYENYGILEILYTSQPKVHWKFLQYQFFLDFLFWSNVIFVLLILVTLFMQKENLHKLPQKEVQFKSN